MKTMSIASMAGTMLLAASGVLAQDVTITYSILWDKATVLPGDSVTAGIYAKIDPGIGTSVPWTTFPGKGQPGTIKYFYYSIFDIINVQNGQLGTLSWTVPAALNVANIPGVPDGKGGITGTYSGQTGSLSPNPVLDNPIKILDLKFTAGPSVQPSEVIFEVAPTIGKVWLNIGIPNYVGHSAQFLIGSKGGFTLLPAPSAALTLGAAALVASRRRRV